MSNLMVDFIMSLDAFGTSEGWPGYWGLEGPEYLAWMQEDEADEHTALMGATTYREMSGYAAEMPDDPSLAALTAMPKVVFSSTLEAPLSWANTELVDGDTVEAVQDMKRRDQRPLRTVGSISLCRSLLGAGLVNRVPDRPPGRGIETGRHQRHRVYDSKALSQAPSEQLRVRGGTRMPGPPNWAAAMISAVCENRGATCARRPSGRPHRHAPPRDRAAMASPCR